MLQHSVREATHLLVWARTHGIRWWNRVCIKNGIRGRGLFATQTLLPQDVALAVPLSSSFSLLNFEQDGEFPLRVEPEDFDHTLAWWPDLEWGTFALIVWLTKAYIQRDSRCLSYLNVLPIPATSGGVLTQKSVREDFPVLRSIARQAQSTAEYKDVIAPVAAQCRLPPEVFNDYLVWMYTMIRSRALPIWSRSGDGHPSFANTNYGRKRSVELCGTSSDSNTSESRGDAFAMFPLLDMMNHSENACNMSIGFAGKEFTTHFTESDQEQSSDFVIAQATKEIAPGEELLVNYNENFGFDGDLFAAWFDIPLHDNVQTATAQKVMRWNRSDNSSMLTPYRSQNATEATGDNERTSAKNSYFASENNPVLSHTLSKIASVDDEYDTYNEKMWSHAT